MEFHRSAGVISFRRTENGREFFLLHSVLVRNPDAAWEFPKGSIESGETETEAALRELSEEAGLTDITLLPDFRDEVHYRYRRDGRDIRKSVVYFIGELHSWDTIPARAPTREHGPEPRTGRWFAWADEQGAHRLLFHPGMRNLLERAALFIHEHDRINRT